MVRRETTGRGSFILGIIYFRCRHFYAFREPCPDVEKDRKSLIGLRSDNMIQSRCEKDAGDDCGWCLGPWLVVVRQWLLELEVLGKRGKIGPSELGKQGNIADSGGVDSTLGSDG